MLTYLLLAGAAFAQGLFFAGLGWWLRGRQVEQSANAHGAAEALLSELSALSASVASDVGEHSSELSKLGRQLAGQDGGDPESSAIGEILVANQKLQEKLAATEAKLRQYAGKGGPPPASAATNPPAVVQERSELNEAIERQQAHPRNNKLPLSLLIINIDPLTDQAGRSAGERVRGRISKALSRLCPRWGIMASHGDEEYSLTLAGTSLAEAGRLAERIRLAIASINQSAAASEPLASISIGLAEAVAGEDSAALIRHARAALLAAKTAGHNSACAYDAGICQPLTQDSADTQERAIQHEMVEAIHQRLAANEAGTTPNDRRHRQRTALDSMQLIAPCTEHDTPEPSDFYKVRCKDVSSGGCAFYLPSFPDFQWLVVALGNGPNHVYLRARVMHCKPVRGSEGAWFVIGCQFTDRMDHCSASAEPVSSSTQQEVGSL